VVKRRGLRVFYPVALGRKRLLEIRKEVRRRCHRRGFADGHRAALIGIQSDALFYFLRSRIWRLAAD
jgi:hypothetical protein